VADDMARIRSQTCLLIWQDAEKARQRQRPWRVKRETGETGGTGTEVLSSEFWVQGSELEVEGKSEMG